MEIQYKIVLKWQENIRIAHRKPKGTDNLTRGDRASR